jgi:N-formylmaleamate deformylase
MARRKGQREMSSIDTHEQLVPGAGININVCQMGDAAKPPLLMIHGIMDEWSSWNLVYDAFLEHYRVIAVDLRGHGKSDKPERGYEPADYAADMASVIQELDVGPIAVVGHSLGAVTTCFLAADYPDLVKAAVMEDPPGRFNRNTGSRVTPMLDIKNGSEEEVYEFFKETGPELGEARWRDQTRRLRNTADGPYQVIHEWAEKGNAPDIVETMSRIQCPTLLMQSDPENGGVLPDDLAAEITGRLRNGEFQRFPGVGHNIHKDVAADFARSALAFLRKHA